jgi:hypothetical protein
MDSYHPAATRVRSKDKGWSRRRGAYSPELHNAQLISDSRACALLWQQNPWLITRIAVLSVLSGASTANY